MERRNEELEIDLLQLFYYLKKRILIIIAACLVFAIAGFVGTKVFITPTYTTNTRMYVLNRSNENNVVTSDFQIATYLMNDYKALITGQNVTQEVIDRLNLDMTPAQLSAKIKVTSPENTRVLQINITDTNPKMAADIANTVRDVASAQIKDIMDVDAVKTVYEAEVPVSPSGPDTMRNTAIAGILGLVLAVGVFTVIFILDDTIRNEEDVTRYLGISTLGVIPNSLELAAAGANKNTGKNKKPTAAPKQPEKK